MELDYIVRVLRSLADRRDRSILSKYMDVVKSEGSLLKYLTRGAIRENDDSEDDFIAIEVEYDDLKWILRVEAEDEEESLDVDIYDDVFYGVALYFCHRDKRSGEKVEREVAFESEEAKELLEEAARIVKRIIERHERRRRRRVFIGFLFRFLKNLRGRRKGKFGEKAQ